MTSLQQLRQQAAAHLAARRFAEADAAYGEVLARAPQDFEALHQRGVIRLHAGAHEEGLGLLAAALVQDPGHAEARMHHAMALQNLGRAQEAAEQYQGALARKPDFPEALFQLGNVLRLLDRLEEAHAAYGRCAELMPQQPAVFRMRGETRYLLGDLDGALADFEAVLGLQQNAPAPQRADTLFRRAVLLENLGRMPEALADYDRVVQLSPGHADAWSNRGIVLRGQMHMDEAEASFRRALALDQRHIAARKNRGETLAMMGRNQDAAAEFERLLQIDPGNPDTPGGMLAAAQALCDWEGVARLLPRLAVDAPAGRAMVATFPMLLSFDDPRLLHDATAQFRRVHMPASAPRPPLRSEDGRIRLAYVSADFCNHATAHLVAGLFARHDRARFEVIAISHGPDDGSPIRAQLRQEFDRFIDVQSLPDAQVAALMRELGIDIAVDLKGYTQWSRSAIFAHGAAPVQASWLGYPGTLASDFIDYVIADPVVLPHDEQPCWDEKIVHLPHSYQPGDFGRPHLPALSRAEAGLPENGFVFGCFNNHRKIGPATFAAWMRLLNAVPDSVLWLLDDTANDRLRGHAAAHGIKPDRILFAPRAEVGLHLRRLACADLMLDTLPCGMHTTASDALWMGVPVITCKGRSFAGRVAASLLTAMECPELITQTQADYETLALALARDPSRLAALKAKLAQKRLTAPLYDAPRFCRHLEEAYAMMMQIARAGLPPRPFDVPMLHSG